MSLRVHLEGTPVGDKVAKLTHLSVFSAVFTVFFLSLLSFVSASCRLSLLLWVLLRVFRPAVRGYV